MKFFYEKFFLMGFDSQLFKSKIKDTRKDDFTQKISFERWFSPISTKLFNEMIERLQST